MEKRVGWVGVSGQSSRLPLCAAGHNSGFSPAPAQELKSGQTGGGVTTAGSAGSGAQQRDAGRGQKGSGQADGGGGLRGQGRMPLCATTRHSSGSPPAPAQGLKSGQTGGGVTTAGSTSGSAQQPDAQGQYGSLREEGRLGNAEPGDGEQAGTAERRGLGRGWVTPSRATGSRLKLLKGGGWVTPSRATGSRLELLKGVGGWVTSSRATGSRLELREGGEGRGGGEAPGAASASGGTAVMPPARAAGARPRAGCTASTCRILQHARGASARRGAEKLRRLEGSDAQMRTARGLRLAAAAVPRLSRRCRAG